MIQAIYDAAASLSTLERMQETVSQNLASGPAAGYRQLQFAVEGASAGKFDKNKGAMPKATLSTSFAHGDLTETGKPTDFAVQGDGFFQVKGADGAQIYTRDGEFQINAQNTLVTKQGYQVMTEGGGPLTLDPTKGQPTVSRDGTVSQDGTTVGKLPLYNFSDTSKLERRDGDYFGAGKATPTPVAKPEIIQGYTEQGNSSSLREMVNLVTVSRAYEASQKLITTHDDLIHQAIQSLGNS